MYLHKKAKLQKKGGVTLSNKKKTQSNDKFNFEDDFIIGISNSEEDKKTKKKKNTSNKKEKNNSKSESIVAEKKQEEQKTQKSYKLIKFLICLCVIAFLLLFFRFSPTFNITTIVIENNDFVGAEEIEALSGVTKGSNLFSISKKRIAKNVEENPYIASVEVSRALPNTIKIKVNERTERYVVQYVEGKFAILDGQGYILAIDETSRGLVSLAGLESNFEELAIKRETEGNVRLDEKDLKKLDMVANIVDTAQNYEVNSFITAIDVADMNDIKINMAGEGKVAYIGNGSDLNTRILFMKTMLEGEQGKNGIMFINVDFTEENPYFRENV